MEQLDGKDPGHGLPFDVPSCGGENACEVIDTFLEQDGIFFLKKDIEQKIKYHTQKAVELQKEIIQTFMDIARMENNLAELRKHQNIEEFTKTLIDQLIA